MNALQELDGITAAHVKVSLSWQGVELTELVQAYGTKVLAICIRMKPVTALDGVAAVVRDPTQSHNPNETRSRGQ